MSQNFKTNEVAASNSGAMEAETILKNGRSLKSHTSRGYIASESISITE